MWRAASRGLRFTGGLLAGLLVLPALGLIGMAALYLAATVGSWFAPEPPARPWVEIQGQDVSVAGGVRIMLKDGSQLLQLDCRGACDDLVGPGGPARQLDVRNAAGACVICQRQDDASWWGRGPKTWLVKGRPLTLDEGES